MLAHKLVLQVIYISYIVLVNPYKNQSIRTTLNGFMGGYVSYYDLAGVQKLPGVVEHYYDFNTLVLVLIKQAQHSVTCLIVSFRAAGMLISLPLNRSRLAFSPVSSHCAQLS